MAGRPGRLAGGRGATCRPRRVRRGVSAAGAGGAPVGPRHVPPPRATGSAVPHRPRRAHFDRHVAARRAARRLWWPPPTVHSHHGGPSRWRRSSRSLPPPRYLPPVELLLPPPPPPMVAAPSAAAVRRRPPPDRPPATCRRSPVAGRQSTGRPVALWPCRRVPVSPAALCKAALGTTTAPPRPTPPGLPHPRPRAGAPPFLCARGATRTGPRDGRRRRRRCSRAGASSPGQRRPPPPHGGVRLADVNAHAATDGAATGRHGGEGGQEGVA